MNVQYEEASEKNLDMNRIELASKKSKTALTFPCFSSWLSSRGFRPIPLYIVNNLTW